ncbi:hypothetical protein ACF0H5_020074 [Mactra antiquata]
MLTLLLFSIISNYYVHCQSGNNAVPSAIHSVGVGYNLLYGNPMGSDLRHGGEDPGLLTTRHILHLDTEADTPYEIVYEHHSSCLHSSSEYLVYSPKSFQDHLKEGFTFAGTSYPSLQASAFALSAGYAAIKKQTHDLHYVLQDSTTTCVQGTARYTLSLADGNFYSLSDEFVTDVCSLPEVYDSAKYTAFLDTWGTHVVTGMKVGNSQTSTTVGKRRDYIEEVLEKSKIDVSIGGPLYGWDSSWVVDQDTLKFRPDVKINVGSSTSTFSTGDVNSPEPIGLNLTSIDTVFTPDFWHAGQYTGVCNNVNANTLVSLRKNIELALSQYASSKGADIPQAENLAIPIVWPMGFGGLPKPKSGCPNPNDEWREGWLHQTTEMQSPSNKWNVTKLEGTFTTSAYTLNFCMKTVQADEFSLEWPAGDYCIFKLNNCPTGFVEGFAQWDDDDTDNRNSHGGVVPDGNYGVDTRLNYCCRSDGYTYSAISLPMEKPFYLFQYKHGCQEVKDMTTTEEYLLWDDEDSNNPTHASVGSVNPNLHLCNSPKYTRCTVGGGTYSTLIYCHYQKTPPAVSVVG